MNIDVSLPKCGGRIVLLLYDATLRFQFGCDLIAKCIAVRAALGDTPIVRQNASQTGALT